jgi:hypothetical protein
MKLRWRVLTKAELEDGKVRGAVTVSRTAHYSEVCVLEFFATGQSVADFWEPVPMEWPNRSPASGGADGG